MGGFLELKTAANCAGENVESEPKQWIYRPDRVLMGAADSDGNSLCEFITVCDVFHCVTWFSYYRSIYWLLCNTVAIAPLRTG